MAVLIYLSAFLIGFVSYPLKAEPQHYYPEHCPRIQPKTDIDFKLYSGTWVELYSSENLDYMCAVFNYIYKPGPPEEYNLTTNAVDPKGNKIQGYSRVLINNSTYPKGRYMDFLPGASAERTDGYFPEEMDIFILDTDYTTFSVEYSCSYKNGTKIEIFCAQHRLGKEPPKKEDVYKILDRNGIDRSILARTQFDNCTASA